MRKIFLLIIISSCLFALNGQKAYRFDNKHFIGYTSNFGHFAMNDFRQNQHNITYKQIKSRKRMLIVNYAFSKNKLNFGVIPDMPTFRQNIADSLNNEKAFILFPEGEAYMRTKTLSVGLRNFIRAKGAIAPYGAFIDMRVGIAHISKRKKDDNLVYRYSNNGDKYLSNELPLLGIKNLNVINFQFGYGASKRIVNNVYFDWLFNVNFNITLWSGDTKNKDVYYRDLFYMRAARNLYLVNNTVGLNFGVHYGF